MPARNSPVWRRYRPLHGARPAERPAQQVGGALRLACAAHGAGWRARRRYRSCCHRPVRSCDGQYENHRSSGLGRQACPDHRRQVRRLRGQVTPGGSARGPAAEPGDRTARSGPAGHRVRGTSPGHDPPRWAGRRGGAGLDELAAPLATQPASGMPARSGGGDLPGGPQAGQLAKPPVSALLTMAASGSPHEGPAKRVSPAYGWHTELAGTLNWLTH
jgi:hypothetical protein